MTSHYFIASLRPIQEFHQENNNFPFISGENYKAHLPFTLPYVYEYGEEDFEFVTFLDKIMEFGDVIELYIYEEGRHGKALSFNYPEEARTINLLNKTYKDQYGQYQLSEKKWKEELVRRTIASKRSVTTVVKY
ncbi:hypothetical protein [Bacillus massilinigeriensis]|uniref:hypothetical protein n=1 Tax=Bacillus mediterraneensis TaxID=1805474 RepID=UPI0008F893B4|nr:hypothetical protein [Bacillus mediterraneensis]